MKCYNDVTSVKNEPVDWIESDSHFEEEIFNSEEFNNITKPKRRYIKRKVTMHPLEGGAGVPAFLAKLWRLVEDPETNNLISWAQVSRNFSFYDDIYLFLSSVLLSKDTLAANKYFTAVVFRNNQFSASI